MLQKCFSIYLNTLSHQREKFNGKVHDDILLKYKHLIGGDGKLIKNSLITR